MSKAGQIAIIALVAAATILLVAFSPILLATLVSQLNIDSQSLGAVGGSYGAASALVAALALCAVVVSTGVQIWQTRISQLHTARSMQFELVRLALDDADLRPLFGTELGRLSEVEWKGHVYLNLWLMHLQMNFLTGALDESGLRRALTGEMFNNSRGANYWLTARSAFDAEAVTRKHKRFVMVVDAEHRNALEKLFKPIAGPREQAPPAPPKLEA